MEKYTVFMDWKNHHSENEYTTKAIPINLPMVFFRELEQIISQFVWKYKKTQIVKANSHSNLEKEEWNWTNQPA